MPLLSAAPRRRRALGLTAAAATMLAAATSAAAAPITYYANPANPAGPRVTISSSTYLPGEKISISGDGFLGSSSNPVGPYVAIKPDDKALLGLTYGSDVAGMRVDEAESPEDDIAVFDADGAGHFEGWVKLPATFPSTGPGTGANAGQHWLRILAGAFPASNPTSQISSFQAFFTQVDRVTLGYTNTASTFFPGSTVPAGGGALTAKAVAFDAGETVAVTLDGAPVTVTGNTADASGVFTATVTIPGGLSAGEHTLAFDGASNDFSATVKVVPSSSTVITPAVRPGGKLAVDVTGFVGVSGAGQKVALNLSGTVIACVQTDATGSARIVATVPEATTIGAKSLNVLAGVKCLTPPVSDPFPRPGVAIPVTVSATAPQASTTAANVAVGSGLPVSVAGFGAAEMLSAKVDGQPIPGAIVVGAEGAVSATVTIPAGTTLGDHVLTLHSPTGVAALTFTATEPAAVVVEQPKPEQPKVDPPKTDPPATTPPVVVDVQAATKLRSLKGGKQIELTIDAGEVRKVKVAVKTSAKVKLTKKGKAKIVTVAKAKTVSPKSGKTSTVKLTLTADGKSLLKTLGKLKVTVTVTPDGAGAATTRTFTLRR